jgi:hypothetical protein
MAGSSGPGNLRLTCRTQNRQIGASRPVRSSFVTEAQKSALGAPWGSGEPELILAAMTEHIQAGA